MAPFVLVITCATPALPLPACVSAGQCTVSPAPSVQLDGAAVARYFVKLDVVPEPSARCATVMAVAGSLMAGFIAAMAGSFQVLIWRWKILATVSASSCRLLRPL